jgi:hypothetical protein
MAVIEELVDTSSLSGASKPLERMENQTSHLTAVLPREDSEVDVVKGEWDLDDSDEEPAEEISENNEDTDATDLYRHIQEEKLGETAEHVFDLLIWGVPFVFIFELFNVLVQQQYQQNITFTGEIVTVITRLPCTYRC